MRKQVCLPHEQPRPQTSRKTIFFHSTLVLPFLSLVFPSLSLYTIQLSVKRDIPAVIFEKPLCFSHTFAEIWRGEHAYREKSDLGTRAFVWKIFLQNSQLTDVAKCALGGSHYFAKCQLAAWCCGDQSPSLNGSVGVQVTTMSLCFPRELNFRAFSLPE